MLEGRPCFSTRLGFAESAYVFGEPAHPDPITQSGQKIFSFNQGDLVCKKDFYHIVPRRMRPNPETTTGHEFRLSKAFIKAGQEIRILIWSNRDNGSCYFMPIGIGPHPALGEDRMWMGLMTSTSVDSPFERTSRDVLDENFTDATVLRKL